MGLDRVGGRGLGGGVLGKVWRNTLRAADESGGSEIGERKVVFGIWKA